MTPKEKASEIVEKYVDIQSELEETTQFYWGYAVKCALIAVDEMINEYQYMSDLESILVVNNEITFVVDKLKYWNEVKIEIEKL